MAQTREGAFRCTEGFVAATKNGTVVVHGGALVPYDYPYEIMDGREDRFTDVSRPREGIIDRVFAVQDPAVEQATAAPGEKRAAKAPKG